ncbi:hypothetical protein AAC387_Pa01g2212 [Persea americana]|eukprot:TRINITY_DN7333_c0_g1_i1.p1 TRINITY_DN7333_c0_g1~~TRINITY_DN7333_c0_g1_i1.p1  ORF type:complete len:233 (-),score=42.01 TRINITY_DN7333_c0_g1_i1:758-1456(-)
MGSFCCCLCGEEFEEYATHPSNFMYRHCTHLRYFLQQLFSGYMTMFQRLEGRTVPSPIQGSTPLASTGPSTTLSDNSLFDPYHSVSRPAPYDADPRFSRLQRDGLVSRREKALSHFQEESQPLRRSSSSSGVENLGSGKKQNIIDFEEDCKAGRLVPFEKVLSAKALQGGTRMLSSEDEDICPTCLEEYTPENPKIITQCSHHFHLGCIYEWMERSESCPVCGKEMEFCETP